MKRDPRSKLPFRNLPTNAEDDGRKDAHLRFNLIKGWRVLSVISDVFVGIAVCAVIALALSMSHPIAIGKNAFSRNTAIAAQICGALTIIAFLASMFWGILFHLSTPSIMKMLRTTNAEDYLQVGRDYRSPYLNVSINRISNGQMHCILMGVLGSIGFGICRYCINNLGKTLLHARVWLKAHRNSRSKELHHHDGWEITMGGNSVVGEFSGGQTIYLDSHFNLRNGCVESLLIQ